ncbi:hypothetical protein PoB_002658400 [Plakobranchus ocellatus]|uniref:Uncharacterized protein n=1 Tax=Plakobranchus ocellatus TaxID=259542 RepID=A0AAV3ZXM9_9GAST|nr:hypothetical protein PoB_002658400 [Plakobranchus ocellatus]
MHGDATFPRSENEGCRYYDALSGCSKLEIMRMLGFGLWKAVGRREHSSASQEAEKGRIRKLYQLLNFKLKSRLTSRIPIKHRKEMSCETKKCFKIFRNSL